jgi:hypothetical protein
MSSYDISPHRGVTAVDPPGCGCTECLTGEYVPLQQATGAQVAALLAGAVGNNTGLAFTAAPGGEPGIVRVIPLFAEDGVPVAGNAPDEPEWHMVETGWNLDARLLEAAGPGLAAHAVPPLAPATMSRIRAGLARHGASLAGEDSPDQAVSAAPGPAAEPDGCACPGRAEGRHDLVCERVLRGAYGSVADAPEAVKHVLRARNRLVNGTVVTPELPGPPPAAHGPFSTSSAPASAL